MKRLAIIYILLFIVITANNSSYSQTGTPSEEYEESVDPEGVAVTSEAAIITAEVQAVVITKEAVPAVVTKEAVPQTQEAVPEEEEIEYFTDVPKTHWAKESVNKLFKMGLTQGYPDGTFRGSNYITRYETAIFLSKMAHKQQIRKALAEKTVEELRSEVYKLRYTLDFYKKEPVRTGPVSGHFNANTRFGNLVSGNAAYGGVSAPIGPVFDYRLMTSYLQEFKGGAYVRLTIDTMDSGFSVPRDFVREMFDFEGGFKNTNSWGMMLTGGPGSVVHREPTNIFPSEDNKVYLRPDNSACLYYDNGSFNAGFKYQTTGITTAGVASIHDLKPYFGYEAKNTPVGKVKFKYSLDQYMNDLRGTVATLESTINIYEMVITPDPKNEIGIRGGTASYNDPGNTFVGCHYSTKDLIGPGSKLKVTLSKIGAKFLNGPGDLKQDDVIGLNLFDKFFKNGTYDIGTEISQRVAEGRSFRVKAGLVLGDDGKYDSSEPDAEATIELNVDYGIFDDAVMTIGYRIYQKPSLTTNTTSDILGIGFNYYF